jgi:hypothetical protein
MGDLSETTQASQTSSSALNECFIEHNNRDGQEHEPLPISRPKDKKGPLFFHSSTPNAPSCAVAPSTRVQWRLQNGELALCAEDAQGSEQQTKAEAGAESGKQHSSSSSADASGAEGTSVCG